MSETKRNRIAVAVTINAVLLVFILFAVVIAQIVQIGILSNRKQQLQDEYNTYLSEYDDRKDLLKKLEEDEQLRKLMAQQYPFENKP